MNLSENIITTCSDSGDILTAYITNSNTIYEYIVDPLIGNLTITTIALMHQPVNSSADEDDEVNDWNNLIDTMDDMNDFFDTDKKSTPIKKDKHIPYSNEPEPRNNQKRTSCYWCSTSTKKVPGMNNNMWDVCSNKKCLHYNS